MQNWKNTQSSRYSTSSSQQRRDSQGRPRETGSGRNESHTGQRKPPQGNIIHTYRDYSSERNRQSGNSSESVSQLLEAGADQGEMTPQQKLQSLLNALSSGQPIDVDSLFSSKAALKGEQTSRDGQQNASRRNDSRSDTRQGSSLASIAQEYSDTDHRSRGREYSDTDYRDRGREHSSRSHDKKDSRYSEKRREEQDHKSPYRDPYSSETVYGLSRSYSKIPGLMDSEDDVQDNARQIKQTGFKVPQVKGILKKKSEPQSRQDNTEMFSSQLGQKETTIPQTRPDTIDNRSEQQNNRRGSPYSQQEEGRGRNQLGSERESRHGSSDRNSRQQSPSAKSNMSRFQPESVSQKKTRQYQHDKIDPDDRYSEDCFIVSESKVASQEEKSRAVRPLLSKPATQAGHNDQDYRQYNAGTQRSTRWSEETTAESYDQGELAKPASLLPSPNQYVGMRERSVKLDQRGIQKLNQKPSESQQLAGRERPPLLSNIHQRQPLGGRGRLQPRLHQGGRGQLQQQANIQQRQQFGGRGLLPDPSGFGKPGLLEDHSLDEGVWEEPRKKRPLLTQPLTEMYQYEDQMQAREADPYRAQSGISARPALLEQPGQYFEEDWTKHAEEQVGPARALLPTPRRSLMCDRPTQQNPGGRALLPTPEHAETEDLYEEEAIGVQVINEEQIMDYWEEEPTYPPAKPGLLPTPQEEPQPDLYDDDPYAEFSNTEQHHFDAAEMRKGTLLGKVAPRKAIQQPLLRKPQVAQGGRKQLGMRGQALGLREPRSLFEHVESYDTEYEIHKTPVQRSLLGEAPHQVNRRIPNQQARLEQGGNPYDTGVLHERPLFEGQDQSHSNVMQRDILPMRERGETSQFTQFGEKASIPSLLETGYQRPERREPREKFAEKRRGEHLTDAETIPRKQPYREERERSPRRERGQDGRDGRSRRSRSHSPDRSMRDRDTRLGRQSERDQRNRDSENNRRDEAFRRRPSSPLVRKPPGKVKSLFDDIVPPINPRPLLSMPQENRGPLLATPNLPIGQEQSLTPIQMMQMAHMRKQQEIEAQERQRILEAQQIQEEQLRAQEALREQELLNLREQELRAQELQRIQEIEERQELQRIQEMERVQELQRQQMLQQQQLVQNPVPQLNPNLGKILALAQELQATRQQELVGPKMRPPGHIGKGLLGDAPQLPLPEHLALAKAQELEARRQQEIAMIEARRQQELAAAQMQIPVGPNPGRGLLGEAPNMPPIGMAKPPSLFDLSVKPPSRRPEQRRMDNIHNIRDENRKPRLDRPVDRRGSDRPGQRDSGDKERRASPRRSPKRSQDRKRSPTRKSKERRSPRRSQDRRSNRSSSKDDKALPNKSAKDAGEKPSNKRPTDTSSETANNKARDTKGKETDDKLKDLNSKGAKDQPKEQPSSKKSGLLTKSNSETAKKSEDTENSERKSSESKSVEQEKASGAKKSKPDEQGHRASRSQDRGDRASRSQDRGDGGRKSDTRRSSEMRSGDRKERGSTEWSSSRSLRTGPGRAGPDRTSRSSVSKSDGQPDKEDKTGSKGDRKETREAGAEPPVIKLVVMPLTEETKAADVKQVFVEFTQVVNCKVAKTPKGQVLAVLTVASQEDAEKCIKMGTGREINGQTIKVSQMKT